MPGWSILYRSGGRGDLQDDAEVLPQAEMAGAGDVGFHGDVLHRGRRGCFTLG
jgi:hypothetical protein